jgi:MOSC domain-containing protein YiiM
MKHPKLLSVQVGMPRDIPFEPEAEFPAGTPAATWRSAFFKQPVQGLIRVGKTAIAGDGQADLRFHGGEDRPVLAYSAEHYARWQNELGYADMPFGGFGENFTITGMDEREVCLGDRYQIGEVRVEVSQPRQPCSKLARRWQNTALPALVIKHNRGGWYFRTLHEGSVAPGMSVELYDRPFPHWTIARAMDVYYHGKTDRQAIRALATLSPLSEQWRTHFQKLLTPEA